MIDDLGEVAQLATEYISTLENLPQEVGHIIKEVEHKDAKVQGELGQSAVIVSCHLSTLKFAQLLFLIQKCCRNWPLEKLNCGSCSLERTS